MTVSQASSAVITIDRLAAARGLRVLFEGLSLSVLPGDVIELRGPNGSGKSTLLRILAGLTRPYAGEVRLSGAAASGGLHYLGHLDAVKPAETAGEQARFWARFFGHDPAIAGPVMKRVGLSARADVPGRGLSAGQKRRLALARLLIDPRPVWLLDEPAAALDTDGRRLAGELVDQHRASGGVVIAAIHGEGFSGARVVTLSDLRAKARA